MYDMQYWIIRPGEAPRRYFPQSLPILYAAHLDTLWAASLLCEVCEERPWTQHARGHAVLVCADCADGEPALED